MERFLIWLAVALVVNTGTYVLTRSIVNLRGGFRGSLARQFMPVQSERAFYLIAGNLNQATQAFLFIEPLMTGTYTCVNFQLMGYNARAMAEMIAADIRQRNQPATVVAISLADQVTRHLEEMLGREVEIFVINPCPDVFVLKDTWRRVAIVPGALVLELGCIALGWLSIVPVIPHGGGYSLQLLADQYLGLALDSSPTKTNQVKGVLISRHDELLDNQRVLQYYVTRNVLEIDARHGDTHGAAKQYRDGLQLLMKRAKSGG